MYLQGTSWVVEHHGNLSEEAIAPCRSPLFTTWNILGGAEEARWRTGEEASKGGALPRGAALSTVHIARFVMIFQYVEMRETF
jgi:hypothetical protein